MPAFAGMTLTIVSLSPIFVRLTRPATNYPAHRSGQCAADGSRRQARGRELRARRELPMIDVEPCRDIICPRLDPPAATALVEPGEEARIDRHRHPPRFAGLQLRPAPADEPER